MTHHITFSITSVHINNSRKEIDLMKDIDHLNFSNAEYDNRAEDVFKENIQHGVLAIYSINAALESLVTILADELKIKEINFYCIVKKLIEDKKIITDIKSYEKCIELRKYRNMITHWDKNYSTLLGTMSYLPYMFEPKNVDVNDKRQTLISILVKVKLKEYIRAFDNIIRNISESIDIKENMRLSLMLECIRDGCITFNL